VKVAASKKSEETTEKAPKVADKITGTVNVAQVTREILY
jgi:hypothetical protein